MQRALPRQVADLQTQAAKRDQAYANFLPRLVDLRWAKAVFLAAQDDELKKTCPPPAATAPQAGAGAAPAPAPTPQPPGTAPLSRDQMKQKLAQLPRIVRLPRLRAAPTSESSCRTPGDNAVLGWLEARETQLSEEYAHDEEVLFGYEALHNTAKVLFGPNDPLTTQSQEDIHSIKEDLADIHSDWLDVDERIEELRGKPLCPPKVLYFVGGGFGAASRVATYDDGFRIRGTTGVFNANAGVRFPLGNGLSVDGVINIFVPFSGSRREYGTTNLNLAVIPQVRVSASLDAIFNESFKAYFEHGISQPERPRPPPSIYLGIGPAIGVLSSGSTFPGFSFSNTQTALGISPSAGVEWPLSENISAYAQFDYIHFPMTIFHSPFGSFKRDENVYAGTVGIKFNIKNWTTNLFP